MILPVLNPDEEKLKELIDNSEKNVANWIKNVETGDMYYWSADSDWITHSVIAETLNIKDYKKGIVTWRSLPGVLKSTEL